MDSRYAGTTLRYLLVNEFRMSGGIIRRLKFSSCLHINGIPARVNTILRNEDIVTADLSAPDIESKVEPCIREVHVLYEDDHMICLDKPSGICTHPAGGLSEATMANLLKGYYIKKGLDIIIRPVSRLDRGTSGVITFAKNAYLHERLASAAKVKEYLAIVHGEVNKGIITVNGPIKRKTFIEREISPDGKNASTLVETLGSAEGYSLIKAYISEGRTHQIRLHLNHIGHPVAGDTLYSDIEADVNKSRLLLHSYRLSFIHPVYKINTEVTAPVPADFKSALDLHGLSYDP